MASVFLLVCGFGVLSGEELLLVWLVARIIRSLGGLFGGRVLPPRWLFSWCAAKNFIMNWCCICKQDRVSRSPFSSLADCLRALGICAFMIQCGFLHGGCLGSSSGLARHWSGKLG